MDSFNSYIVDTKQLLINVTNIRRRLTKDTKFCAVVKANAYGMGLEVICKVIKPYCDYFAVACVSEAKRIRAFDTDTKILILGVIPQDNYRWCSENNVSITVGSLLDIDRIIGSDIGHINVHIAINTGLNRLGISTYREIKTILSAIKDTDNITVEGVFTHFATKSSDVLYMKKQFYKFGLLKKHFKYKVTYHVSNSFATLYSSMYHLDMVRNGYLLYGYINDVECNNKPILSIQSRLVHIFKVSKYESIGYDRSFVADTDMVVGVVPIGYADGLDRRLSNKGYLYIKNKKCRIVGNICMDMCMVDITHVDAKVLDSVLVLGTDGINTITPNDYAKILATSPYEVLLKFRYDRMNYVVI